MCGGGGGASCNNVGFCPAKKTYVAIIIMDWSVSSWCHQLQHNTYIHMSSLGDRLEGILTMQIFSC